MKGLNILIVIVCIILIDYDASAYDEKIAHPQITEAAIIKSNLDAYLKDYLGLPNGKDAICNGTSILNSLQSGSMNEDLSSRGLNHFWNPLVHTLNRPRKGNWGRVHIKAGWPV